MSKKKPQPKAVVITCTSTSAQAVFVAGSFNNWNPEAEPMENDGEGHWSASITLPSGRHEYKFVIDGQWCCEQGCEGNPDCPNCVPDGHDGMNRFIDVE